MLCNIARVSTIPRVLVSNRPWTRLSAQHLSSQTQGSLAEWMASVPTRTLERIAMHPERHIPQHVHVPPQLARRAVVDALTSLLLKPAVVKSQLPSLVRILSRLSTMPEFTQHMQIWLTAAAAAVEVAPHAISIPSGPHSLIRLLHVYAKCWPNRHATCILASALLPLLTPGLSRLGAPELPMQVDAVAKILSP